MMVCVCVTAVCGGIKQLHWQGGSLYMIHNSDCWWWRGAKDSLYILKVNLTRSAMAAGFCPILAVQRVAFNSIYSHDKGQY